MATGFDFLFKSLGIDKEKVEQAIAGIGQIAVAVRNDMQIIKAQNAAIIEALREAGYNVRLDAAGSGDVAATNGSGGALPPLKQ